MLYHSPTTPRPYPFTCSQEVRPYVEYFDLAVVAPGLAAAVLMLLAACCSLRSRGWPCCPCGPCRRRRFVLPKCCIFLGDLALLLGIVLYTVFAAVGLSVFLPALRQYAATVYALCDTVVPQLRQAL